MFIEILYLQAYRNVSVISITVALIPAFAKLIPISKGLMGLGDIPLGLH